MIKLLKNIAYENRQSEQKNLFPNRTFCQRIAVSVQNYPFLRKKLHTQQLCYTPEVGKCQYLAAGIIRKYWES